MAEQPFDLTNFNDFNWNGWAKRITDPNLRIVHKGGNYYLESSAGYFAFIFIDKPFLFEPHTDYALRFDYRSAARVAASISFWNGLAFLSVTLDASTSWTKITVPFSIADRPDQSMLISLRLADTSDGPPIDLDNLEILSVPPESKTKR